MSFLCSPALVYINGRDEIGLVEVLDPELLDYRINAHELVVINPRLVGKRLSELELPRNYGCFATELIRAGVELPLTDEVVLLKGDRLHIVGEEARLRELGEYLGYIEEEVEETDLVTFSFGIVVGVLLGMIVFKIAGVSIGLGTAGGLLVAGITIGYLSSINPTFGRVPAPARYLLREFGLMLLMASIGLNAGTGIVEGLASVGLAISDGEAIDHRLHVGETQIHHGVTVVRAIAGQTDITAENRGVRDGSRSARIISWPAKPP